MAGGERRRIDRAGFVYILKGGDGLHKLGRSKNPTERRKKMSGLPWPVVLVHQIATDDADWLEKELHARFGGCRVHGEWFRLTDADLELLCSMERYNRSAPRMDAQTTGFGTQLRRLREAAGLTQPALARRTGCTADSISRIERGAHEPAWPLVLALAAALGVTPSSFVPPMVAPEVASAVPPKPRRQRKQEGSQ